MGKVGYLLDAGEHFLEAFLILQRGLAVRFLLFLIGHDLHLRFCEFLFLLEPLHATEGVDELHLTRIERMAIAAYVSFDFRFGGSDGKRIAAGTGNLRVGVPFRMNI
jgi:hypothetical protein